LEEEWLEPVVEAQAAEEGFGHGSFHNKPRVIVTANIKGKRISPING
jgi:hypothetical protein